MRYATSILYLAAPLAAYAAPVKRVAALDVTVLKFADVLEQLESQFYSTALSKFTDSDFSSAGFSASLIATQQITVIQSDESTHASVLEAELAALGESPITSCSFNFDSALTDVATMAATARVVENLGVSAYLGAAQLVSDPQLLEAAGSILTVEARHQTILNVLSGTGSAIPAAFDLALTPSEVLAVATPFISGACDLGVPANPSLAITNTGSVGPGTTLTFQSSAINSSVSTDSLSCQMLVGGNPISISLPYSSCTVPEGINGPVAIFITSDNNPLQSNVVNRASANNILAGPTLAFIDTSSEMLGQMVRVSSGSGSASAVSSVTTQTISPDEASSIIASGSAVATDAAAATDSSAASATLTDSAAAAAATDSSAASATDSAASASASSVNNANSTPGGPNMFTGPSADGSIQVDGWSNLPAN